ncbi:MAG: dTDP-4-dehydrorhamnose 3,5-epimerase family protein [Acidobacteriota bacterium]|nr:dTDP-4-dehydrorhamnose 3,5-epimerase family protein [Acidobacteriota bacterium]
MQPKSVSTPEAFKVGEINDVVIRDLKRFTDARGWLVELFRQDELNAEFYPVMAYTSLTKPGVTRGPHEHVSQADLFCFLGPSNFKLRLWDNRAESETFNYMTTLVVGEDNPKSVLIPAGVVHAYQNIGSSPGIVINCANRLYMGFNKKEAIDEIRHEDDPGTIYRMDN